MLSPGLAAENCPNHEVCGLISELAPEEEVELIRIRQHERERIQELILVDQRGAAKMMLASRGCPQSLEAMRIPEAITEIEAKLIELRTRLEQFEGEYIAPFQCELHSYNVKRPWGTYGYFKLSSEIAIFEPSEKQEKVKVIHCSKEGDPRHTVAQEGIERRNKLSHLSSRLIQIKDALNEVLASIEPSLESENIP